MKPGWEVVDGVPFYRSLKSKGRVRGQWRTCQQCGATFASVIANIGKYCSARCRGKGSVKPRPNARQDLFADLTPEECWLIGLIWADGCLVRGGVTLVSTDLELAEAAARIARAKIWTRLREAPLKTAYVVQISGAAVVERLRALGLTERKSHSASIPDVPHLSDFVRGYFDGDGTVGLYRSPNIRLAESLPRLTSGFIGSHQMMTQLQPILLAAVGIAPKKVHASGSVWRLAYNHRDSIRLASFMYQDETAPRLTRKRMIFAEGAAQPFPAATAPLHIRIGVVE